jgi:acyl dehydratase
MTGPGGDERRMTGKTIADLKVGDHAEYSRRIEQSQISGLVEAVGDYNPIHSDPAFAAATAFKEPIAPGVFTAGLISAVIGTQLPGPGAIYLSQTLKFLRPVRPGDTVTARAEVLEVIRERNRIRLATICTNQRGEEVLSGEAWVMPAKTAVHYEPRPQQTAAALGALAVQPWAWAAQVMTLWGTLGLSMLRGAGPFDTRGLGVRAASARTERYIKSPPLMETSAPVT